MLTAPTLEKLQHLKLDAMAHAFDLRVPLEVNLSYGRSWADAKS